MATNSSTKNGKKAPEEKVEELRDAIDSRKLRREQRVLGPKDTPWEGFDKIYVQRRLSSFPRLEFIAIVSKAINETLDDSDDTTIALLIAQARAGGAGMEIVDVFVKLFTRLAMSAPEVLKEIYMLSLGVPIHERELVAGIWGLPEEDDGSGGLSDEDDEAIMRTFIAQNAEALNDFFTKRLPALVQEAQEAISQTSGS